MDNNVFNSVKYIVVMVSTLCNLKCKNCITFTPYQKHPRNFKVSDIVSDINMFFQIFYDVRLEHLDFGGGEPFLHPELPELTQYVLDTYHSGFEQLRILTNGSVAISKKLLSIAKNDNVFILVDNYGKELSPYAEENIKLLEDNNIQHRMNIYHGVNQYLSGWVDWGDLSYKNYTSQELEFIRLNCFDIYSESEICKKRPCDHVHIKNGRIHWCDMQQVGAEHIPSLPHEYIDMRSGDSIDDIREKCLNFKKGLIEYCKYCAVFYQWTGSQIVNGNTHGNRRVPAGIQLTKDEMANLHPICE